MKKSEIKNLTAKSKEELSKLLKMEKEAITKLILEGNTGKNKNTMILGQKKKKVARILTLIRQKEL